MKVQINHQRMRLRFSYVTILNMEMITILGLILGFGGILLGNILEGGHVASLVQGAAFVIVMSGTIGATMVSSKPESFKKALEFFKRAFIAEDDDAVNRQVIDEIIDCAKQAKKDGLLSLEARLATLKNPFLKDVLRAVVDGIDPVLIRESFENHISIEEEKLNSAAKVWTDAGGYAPTVGIIGAVLGLIHVMGNLSDTSKLGAGIAVAFVATIYGVCFANLLFLPIGNKLKKKVSDDMRKKEMILEGCLCVQNGLPASLILIRLNSYLEKT